MPDWLQTAAERQTQTKDELKQYAARVGKQRMAAGITWQGNVVQTDPESQFNVAAEALAAQIGTRPSPDTFRMADNSMPALSNAEMLDMAVTVRNGIKAIFATLWQVKADIDAGTITSRGEVDNAPWPVP